jgi:hypothetical protein
MFASKHWKLCRKLLILGAMAGFISLFSSSRFAGDAYADACMQDCQSQETSCTTDCATTYCTSSSTEAECSACMSACESDANYCYRHSVWCENHEDGVSCGDPGMCCAQWGELTDVSTGHTYNGYFGICQWYIGGGTTQCQECPSGTSCPGGLPPCGCAPGDPPPCP